MPVRPAHEDWATEDPATPDRSDDDQGKDQPVTPRKRATAPTKPTAGTAEPTAVEPTTVDPDTGDRDVKPADTTTAARRHEPGSRDLNLGDSGTDVAHLQRHLGVEPDGQYGPATARAVRVWQKARGRALTGTVNARMWRDLAATTRD